MSTLKYLWGPRRQLFSAGKHLKVFSFSSLHTALNPSVELHTRDEEVVIALGSNVGDRLNNFREALKLMKNSGIHITRHGCLYETAPAYVTDQPRFINSAVRAVTKLGPHELLAALKKIEKDPGCTNGEASEEDTTTDGWEEEEDEAEPKIGDGGDGGGVALQNVPWGQRALSIAEEVLMQFGEDMELFAFRTTPRGYVYVRLDKLTNEYGCPSMEELERYNQEFKKRLDEVGALGEIPDDLAIEVSTPGAERILRVPGDLSRFKDMPMRVCYTENIESNCSEGDGVFLLDSIEKDSEICVWKLANVKENRDPLRKGRPLSRKQKDWRLKLPFNMHRMVTLYLP